MGETSGENEGGEVLKHEGQKEMAGWLVDWLTGGPQCRQVDGS